MIANALIIALGWTMIAANECNSNEKKIYVLSDKGAHGTWTEALGECGRRGMTLATIRTYDELKEFNETLVLSGRSNSEYFMLGGSCEGGCAAGKTENWYWITDNTKLSSSGVVNYNWAEGEPDNAGGVQRVLAVVPGSGKWDDIGYAEPNIVYGWVCQQCARKTCVKKPSCEERCEL